VRAVAFVTFVASAASWFGPSTAHAVAARPNIVLIVTDDQRWDTLWAMPNVEAELAARGETFTHAHVVTPLCCPARAQILTGQYAHTTGVYGNHNGPHGGFNAFDDSTTVATVLHHAGYRTALIGRYLNGYGDDGSIQPATYVPPGWDRWSGTVAGGDRYYGYTQNEDGALLTYGTAASDYITDVLGQEVVDFIDEPGNPAPFFVEWAPPAPHKQAVPEAAHAHDFDALTPWRPDSYDERNVRDKPQWMRAVPRISQDAGDAVDLFRQRQYDTLQSVDEWVSTIVDTLAANGVLQDTMIVFTSDNGYLWGEHRMSGKNVPYEEATRVPLVVRYDALGAAGTSPTLAANIDLAPTFAEIAGTAMPDADGVSMVPFLTGSESAIRREHLIEQQAVGRANGIPAWCMLQRERAVLTHYGSGEEEFYNLARDPLQLQNRIGSAKLQSRIDAMRRSLRALCDPLPPGMPAW
jgi:N-acetylglucosamine-6-sulfatase